MLILTRRAGERLLIGDDIVVKIIRIDGGQVRVGIEAPDNVRIVREEIADRPATGTRRIGQPRACDNFLATARDDSTCHICLRPRDEHAA